MLPVNWSENRRLSKFLVPITPLESTIGEFSISVERFLNSGIVPVVPPFVMTFDKDGGRTSPLSEAAAVPGATTTLPELALFPAGTLTLVVRLECLVYCF
jgi:hypothetical protein